MPWPEPQRSSRESTEQEAFGRTHKAREKARQARVKAQKDRKDKDSKGKGKDKK
jgi:hypothetical protein